VAGRREGIREEGSGRKKGRYVRSEGVGKKGKGKGRGKWTGDGKRYEMKEGAGKEGRGRRVGVERASRGGQVKG